MPALLLNDGFVISLIMLSALFVRRAEMVSALIYSVMAWVALGAVNNIHLPESVLAQSENRQLVIHGFELLMCSISSLVVIALVYAIRLCMGGKLPGLIIWLCLFEIGMHASCYVMLWKGMDVSAYNWVVLANQAAAIALFMSRWRLSHGGVFTHRFLRDSVRSH